MAQYSKNAVLIAGIIAAAGLPAVAQPLVVIYAEDFESFPLAPNQEEGVVTGNDQGCYLEAVLGDGTQCGAPNANTACAGIPAFIDCGSFVNSAFDGQWSHNGWDQLFGYDWDGDGPSIAAPAGVGTAEWQGWSIADRDFWMNSDFQDREQFTNASGRIAVADPDEWDDFDPFGIDPDGTGVFNTSLTSPVISLTGVTPNTVLVRFDSSWRWEGNQKVSLNVSFNGGPFTKVEVWDSDPASPDFKPDATNESVEISVNNPSGATSMRLQWEMYDAINNWWWAVDNIQVAAQGGQPVDPPANFTVTVPTFNDSPIVTVSWTQSLNATNYDVIFANDAAFTDVAILQNTTGLSFTTSTGQLLAGSYYVKVVAKNAVGTLDRQTQIGVDNDCTADIDGSGVLNFFDISRYLQLYNNG